MKMPGAYRFANLFMEDTHSFCKSKSNSASPLFFNFISTLPVSLKPNGKLSSETIHGTYLARYIAGWPGIDRASGLLHFAILTLGFGYWCECWNVQSFRMDAISRLVVVAFIMFCVAVAALWIPSWRITAQPN
jgi:hypothetical protein